MTGYGWTALTFVNIVIVFTILFKRYGKFWLISIPGAFMLFYTIFNVVGANYLCSNYMYFELKYIIAMNLALIIHLIGFLLIDHVFKFNFRLEMKSYVDKPVNINNNRVFKISFTFVVIIIFIVTIMYLKLLQSIPIVDLVTSSNKVLELAKARELATTTFSGKYHRYSFFFKVLLPIFSLISLAAAYKNRDNFWKIMFTVLFIATCFMLIADIQKGPILFYFISVFFLLFILRKKVDIKKLILITIMFLIILIIMYLFIVGLAGRGIGTVFSKISLRLFIAQTKGVYTAFRVFPSHHDFLFGRSFPNPGGIFPFEPFELTKYVFKEMYGYGRYIVGTAPTPYFVEFYMNFGYFAMIISMLVGSFLIQISHIIFVRSEKNVVNLGLYAFILVLVGKMGLTSIFQTFGPKMIMLLIFIQIYKITINTFAGVKFENSNNFIW